MSLPSDFGSAERHASVTFDAERHAGVTFGPAAMRRGGAK